MSTPSHTIVSVDLDDVACYHGIHGLGPADPATLGTVLARCLPRFLELFEETGVRATFFLIGRDLERDLEAGGKGAALLKQALAAGHELANHSYAHDYRMTEWSSEAIHRDLARCDGLLRRLGANPRGFRAPGYLHHDRMLAQVAALGYRYDSSPLPSPAYYLAKVGMIRWMRYRGRQSASPTGGWKTFFGSPYSSFLSELGLWQVPVGVSPLLRLPMVGNALLAGPRGIASFLRQTARTQPLLHLVLHGLDLGDAGAGAGDGYAPELVEHQRELQVPLPTRREQLAELLSDRGGGVSILTALGSTA